MQYVIATIVIDAITHGANLLPFGGRMWPLLSVYCNDKNFIVAICGILPLYPSLLQ